MNSVQPAPPVLIVGAGLSGIATALRLADHGRSSIVLERAAKVGGASAFSAGQVWVPANHIMELAGIEDSLEDGEAYVTAIAKEDDPNLDHAGMRRWIETAPQAAAYFEELGAVSWGIIPKYPDYFHPTAPGSRSEGRYLGATCDARRLGEWRSKMNITPHFPNGTTYAELFGVETETVAYNAFGTTLKGAAPGDRLTFGPGVFGSFLARALQEDGIEIRTETRACHLLREGDGAVVGVEIEGGAKLRGPVVIATSGFDWDPALVERFWGISPENFGSISPPTIAGDGIRLCEEAGADVAELPADHIPMVPGYADPSGRVSHKALTEHCLPHTFIVNGSGQRFCRDDLYWELVEEAAEPDSQLPFYAIWDEQHHTKYGLGDTDAGAPYPEGLVESAGSLAELGEKLGVDGAALEATAQTFNRTGGDPAAEFGRGASTTWRIFMGDQSMPNPNFGPVTEAPFHGLRLVLTGNAIGMSGVRIDADAHALNAAGERIEGLHVVGSAAAFTSSGSGYNSGYALSRAITHAYLVGAELGGRRDDAPVS